MSSIVGLGELVRGQVAAEMVATAGGHVQGAEDFFVLNVASRDWQFLRAEAKFAKFSGHRVALEFSVMGVDRRLLAIKKFGIYNFSTLDGLKSKSAIRVLHDETTFAVGGDKVNFAGR